MRRLLVFTIIFIIKRYDSFPVIAAVASMFVVVASMMFLAWVFNVMTQLLYINSMIAAVILTIPFIYVYIVAAVVVVLINEVMWKFFGIYKLFKISGTPLRSKIGELVGIK